MAEVSNGCCRECPVEALRIAAPATGLSHVACRADFACHWPLTNWRIGAVSDSNRKQRLWLAVLHHKLGQTCRSGNVSREQPRSGIYGTRAPIYLRHQNMQANSKMWQLQDYGTVIFSFGTISLGSWSLSHSSVEIVIESRVAAATYTGQATVLVARVCLVHKT